MLKWINTLFRKGQGSFEDSKNKYKMLEIVEKFSNYPLKKNPKISVLGINSYHMYSKRNWWLDVITTFEQTVARNICFKRNIKG